MNRYRDDMSTAEQARLLTECAALDAAYARTAADEHLLDGLLPVRHPEAEHEEAADEITELHKAALSRGQP